MPFPIGDVGVPCALFVGDNEADAIVEQVTEQGPQATVKLKCPWSLRWDLYAALLGTTVMGEGGSFSIHPPATYPTVIVEEGSGGTGLLICTAITAVTGIKYRTDPEGTLTGMAGWGLYEFAVLTAVFTRPNWYHPAEDPGGQADASGLPYTTTRIKTNSEVYNPPTGAYYYQAGKFQGQPIFEGSLGIMRNRAEISMVRHRFPALPLSRALTDGGCVNDDVVTFGDYDFAKGCLLFTGNNSDPTGDAGSVLITQDVEFTFLGDSENDWNSVMDPDGVWQIVNSDSAGAGKPPFKYVDFQKFFGWSL